MYQLSRDRTHLRPQPQATRLYAKHAQIPNAGTAPSEPDTTGCGARHAGISAADAALAEQTFLRRVHNLLTASGELWDPCRQTAVRVPRPLRPTHRVNRLVAVRRTAFDQMCRWRWLDDCPHGAEVLFDLRRYTWWGRLRGRVLVELHSLARLELFAAAGYDDGPATRAEVEQILNRSWRRAAAEQIPHLVVLFSPTGWTPEADDFVRGQDDSAFRDPLVSVGLFDQNGLIAGRDLRVV